MFNGSITQVAACSDASWNRHVVIVQSFNRIVVQSYSMASLGRSARSRLISHSFALEVPCVYERESVAILIEPTLVLSPPSNCTRILGHVEINSTHGKYSRKCGTMILWYRVNIRDYWIHNLAWLAQNAIIKPHSLVINYHLVGVTGIVEFRKRTKHWGSRGSCMQYAQALPYT